MKKMVMAMVAVASAIAAYAAMPRSEWHAKVGDCALDPAELKAVMSQLSSEDKTAFLAEVNAAIAKMPGSDEVKAAAFLNANRAAVAEAGAADRMAVLAEVYATVPVEHLTVISESFAKSEFARPATMGDVEMAGIVEGAMAKIVERTATSDAGSERAAFAGLMFLRAAGDTANSGTPVSEAVFKSLPNDVSDAAKSTWYPNAMAENPSYDQMLAAAGAGEEADPAVVAAISGGSLVDSMLSDLQGADVAAGTTASSVAGNGNIVGTAGVEGEANATSTGTGTLRIPRDRILNETLPQSVVSGDPKDKDTEVPNPDYAGEKTQPEPGPYNLQNP